MDGRNYGSGYSSWGGSGNRGSNSFDLYGGGYKDSMRDSFSSGLGGGSGRGGWAGAGRRAHPRRGGSAGGRGAGGGFGGRRSDPTPLGGGGWGGGSGGRSHYGHSQGGGRGKLPSLLPTPSNRMYPETGGFHQGAPQGPRNFPVRNFGGGPWPSHQRDCLFKQVKPRSQRDGQKRKPTVPAADEPESKMNKTETAGTKGTQESVEKNGDAKTPAASSKPASEGDKPPTEQEENSEAKKQSKQRRTRGVLRRVTNIHCLAMFACSVCKYSTFYKEDMANHLESRFHKDHLKFLSSHLSKPTTDFLQEYLKSKCKKTQDRIRHLENHSAAICQFYKEQDLTRELGLEHFMRKVEAAHCAACDVYVPMQQHLIQRHINSPDHNYNRNCMMEQSKRTSLSVARSILKLKEIGKKLDSFLKGENPFNLNKNDQDPEDFMAMEVSEMELTNDNQVEAQAEADPTEAKLDSTEAEAKVEPAKDEAAPEEMIEAEPEGEIVPGTVESDRTEGEVVPEAVEDDGRDKEIVPEADVGDGTEAEKLEEDLGVEGVEEEEEDQGEHEEGFEIGDEEGCEDEEGVEHDLEEEEDEGIVETEVDDELKNDDDDYDDDDDGDGVVVLD